jgi:hypothetical protein
VGGTYALSKTGQHFFLCRENPDSDRSINIQRYAVAGAMEAEVKISISAIDPTALETRVACGTIDVEDANILRIGISSVHRQAQQFRNVGSIVTLDQSFASTATPVITNIHDTTIATTVSTSGYRIDPWSLRIVRAPDSRAYVASAWVEPAADLSSSNRKFRIVRLGTNGLVDTTFSAIDRSVFVISGNISYAEPFTLLFDDFGKMISILPSASSYVFRPEN